MNRKECCWRTRNIKVGVLPSYIGQSSLHVPILDLGTVCKLDNNTDLITPAPVRLGTVHYLAPEWNLRL